MTNIYYLTVSLGWESGMAYVCASDPRSFTRLRVPMGSMVSLEDWTLGGSASKLTHMVVGRIQFLVCFWTEGLSSLITAGQRPRSVPCHVGLSKGQLTRGSWHLSVPTREREVVPSLCYSVFVT